MRVNRLTQATTGRLNSYDRSGAFSSSLCLRWHCTRRRLASTRGSDVRLDSAAVDARWLVATRLRLIIIFMPPTLLVRHDLSSQSRVIENRQERRRRRRGSVRQSNLQRAIVLRVIVVLLTLFLVDSSCLELILATHSSCPPSFVTTP